MTTKVPHLRIVIAFCLFAVLGYLGFSIYVVGWMDDKTVTGDVIGTWKSFAVAAFAFWVGSSSAGKAKDGDPPQVEVVNTPDKPVLTEDVR